MLRSGWQIIPIDGVMGSLGARHLTLTPHHVSCHSVRDNGGLADIWGVTKSRTTHAQTEHLRDLGRDAGLVMTQCVRNWVIIILISGTMNPNCPRVWWVMISYDELWRPFPVSDYSETDSNIIDPTPYRHRHRGYLSSKMEHFTGWFKFSASLNKYWWFNNYFLPFSFAQRAHIARWS